MDMDLQRLLDAVAAQGERLAALRGLVAGSEGVPVGQAADMDAVSELMWVSK